LLRVIGADNGPMPTMRTAYDGNPLAFDRVQATMFLGLERSVVG